MKAGPGIRAGVPAELHGDGRFVIAAEDFAPAYLRAHVDGRLRAMAEQARETLRSCMVCPRQCRVNRLAGATGVCGVGRQAQVSSAFPHLGEEDCLRGWRGSGTIFFSGCNLRCVFCQSFQVSQQGEGREITAEVLAALMLELQGAGCALAFLAGW